jgi:hypothetical protein
LEKPASRSLEGRKARRDEVLIGGERMDVLRMGFRRRRGAWRPAAEESVPAPPLRRTYCTGIVATVQPTAKIGIGA